MRADKMIESLEGSVSDYEKSNKELRTRVAELEAEVKHLRGREEATIAACAEATKPKLRVRDLEVLLASFQFNLKNHKDDGSSQGFQLKMIKDQVDSALEAKGDGG